jgi:hypothetical protein
MAYVDDDGMLRLKCQAPGSEPGNQQDAVAVTSESIDASTATKSRATGSTP